MRTPSAGSTNELFSDDSSLATCGIAPEESAISKVPSSPFPVKRSSAKQASALASLSVLFSIIAAMQRVILVSVGAGRWDDYNFF